MKRYFLILLILSFLVIDAKAQLFTEVTTAVFPGVYIGNCKWGDYNKDGSLDLFLTGYAPSSVRIAKIYTNNGDHTFTDNGAPLTQVGNSFGEWCDFNTDNIIDLIYGGNVTTTPSSTALTKLYRNTGPGTFTEITPTGFPDLFHPEIAWGDFDNDGDQDLVYGGEIDAATSVCTLYRNNGNGQLFPKQVLDSISDGYVAFADYNNDGFNDLILTGSVGSWDYITKLYKNNGNDSLINSGQIFTGLRTSSAAWGDYDSDGDLDLLLTGSDNTDVLHTEVYKNTNGNFSNISAPLIPVRYGKAAWGDYDNDGDLDIILIGQINSTGSVMITSVYKNNGNDLFTEVTGLGLPGLRRSYAAWGDYNNDGKLDFAILGRNSGGTYLTKLFKNNTTVANTPPSVPTNLVSVRVADTITLSWNPSTDSQTLSSGLTYNLRLGTTPGGSEVCSPMSNLSSGFLNLAQIGNMNLRTFAILKNLPEGTYYWSVQAVDNAFSGSAFAPEQTFVIANPKTLTLSVLLEGLYNGASVMNQAFDASGPHWPVGIADHLTVELHNALNYPTIEYSADSVELTTTGSAVVSVPGNKNGTYYLTIRHRSGIETTSALPVDFSGSSISYSFSPQSQAFGSNLGLMWDGGVVIFSGDVNQDGLIDGTDLNNIGNLNDLFSTGYLVEDINGDGLIDGSDLNITGNNNDGFIGAIVP